MEISDDGYYGIYFSNGLLALSHLHSFANVGETFHVWPESRRVADSGNGFSKHLDNAIEG